MAEAERAINSVLALVDKWYDLNGLKRNNSKYQAIFMGKTQNKPTFRSENIIPITSHSKMLSVNVDDQLKFNNHVSKVSNKVSQQIAVFSSLRIQPTHIAPAPCSKWPASEYSRLTSPQYSEAWKKKKVTFWNLTGSVSFNALLFNYFFEMWHFCRTGATDKLEKINERAIRFVSRQPRSQGFSPQRVERASYSRRWQALGTKLLFRDKHTK